MKLFAIAFVLNFVFGIFEFVSDLVLRISNLQEIDLANKFDITTSYSFK